MAVQWTRKLIASEAFESAVAIDVDGDGVLDIVSGAFWYRGPDFFERYETLPVARFGEYYDDFSALPLPMPGFSKPALVTGGFWGGTLRYRRLPEAGTDGWTEHVIGTTDAIETTRLWDVDRDGRLEVVPNQPGAALVVYRPPTRFGDEFARHVLFEGKQGHGLGFGDVSGSGRGDFVMNHGWLEAPEEPWREKWTYHPDFDLGEHAGVPILVADIDGDGRTELIVGNGHGYGLDLWKRDSESAWRRTPIDSSISQAHDLKLIDIDGDGVAEIVTGKRWRAHPNDMDPGNYDDLQLSYYKWRNGTFEKHVIASGPLGVGVGTGIAFDAADLRGTGRLDLILPGKDGLHVLFNEGERVEDAVDPA